MKFYVCAHCGNIIAYVEDKDVPVSCCGEIMQELVPNTKEASVEKHLPVIEQAGTVVTVKIGSAPHPMLPEHYIGWVALETKQGNQRKPLPLDGAPQIKFALTEGDEIVAAYAWCNLHGLWKA